MTDREVEPLSIGDPGRAAAGVGVGLPPREVWPSDIAVSEHASTQVSVRAASLRGVLHRNGDGAPRQDAFAVAVRPTTEIVAGVVCDGVGSLAQSHVAANHVASSVLDDFLQGKDWTSSVASANDSLMEVQALGPMATTVVAVSIEPRADGMWVDAAGVGDSELWHLEESHWKRILPPLDGLDATGDVSTGKAKALPSTKIHVESWSGLIASGAIFLMSDGVGTPLAMSAMVRETLAQWWTSPPTAVNFAHQVGFAKASFVDDRTVVGFWLTKLSAIAEEDANDGQK